MIISALCLHHLGRIMSLLCNPIPREWICKSPRSRFLSMRWGIACLPSKATSPDGIPARILKERSEQIAPSLCALINYSLRVGRFPSDWKSADITPVHKKDLPEPAENYRPISLLPIVSKVMECCICNRLFSHDCLHLYNTDSCILACALRNFCPYFIQSGRHLSKTNRQMFCTLILPRLSIQLTTSLLLKSWNDTVLRANYLVGFLAIFWTDRRESWLMAKPPCVYRSLLVYPRVALSAHSSLWYFSMTSLMPSTNIPALPFMLTTLSCTAQF